MKAIVLAGGHATRLWPITRDRAKPLLPLGDQPIIGHIMDELDALDAVDEILISTNAKFADDFQDFLDGAYPAAEVVVEDHTTEAGKIGSLGAIMQVVDEYGDDDYLVVGGDNYTSLSLAEFVQYGQDADAVTLGCYRLDDRADATAFGVVETGDDRTVTGFQEKPDEPRSRLISTAFYFFPASSLDMFDAYRDAHRGSDADYLDEPGRLIQWGHERHDMRAYPFAGDWFDIGTPENYLRAQAAVGGTRIDGSVTDSDIGDNVFVMEGAHVSESTLEDCIVFPGAEITGSSLDGCIIGEEATVSDMSLQDAVIGSYSRVR